MIALCFDLHRYSKQSSANSLTFDFTTLYPVGTRRQIDVGYWLDSRRDVANQNTTYMLRQSDNVVFTSGSDVNPTSGSDVNQTSGFDGVPTSFSNVNPSSGSDVGFTYENYVYQTFIWNQNPTYTQRWHPT